MILRRKLWLIIASIFLAVGLCVTFAWVNFLATPIITQAQGFRFVVPAGASYKTVTNDLYARGVLNHPLFFAMLFRVRGDVQHLKAGEYLFPPGATASKVIDQIVYGKGMVYHAFTIVPGSNFHQLRENLNKDPNVVHTSKNLTNEQIMQRIGEGVLHPEGQFFPDTYYFAAGSSDLILLKRAHTAMQEKLAKAWESRDANLPYQNAYQALTAASIIEKEAHEKRELPIISGVLINRLRKNILLQFDPTVIYGVGDSYRGAIYKSDLAARNPYNTYLNKGLPPTPISMPGLDAIDAIMHPAVHNYLYFVAKGNGAHQFSETLEQHAHAVAEARQLLAGFFNAVLMKKYLGPFFSAFPEWSGVAAPVLECCHASAGWHPGEGLVSLVLPLDASLRWHDRRESVHKVVVKSVVKTSSHQVRSKAASHKVKKEKQKSVGLGN